MTKYEDLRPCAYNIYEGENNDSRDYPIFKETVYCKFHKFSSHFQDCDAQIFNYAIVETENGNIKEIPTWGDDYDYPERNFRFTDHTNTLYGEKPHEEEQTAEPEMVQAEFDEVEDSAEPEKEVTYKVGDRFLRSNYGIEYTLISIKGNLIALYQDVDDRIHHLCEDGVTEVLDVNKITFSDLSRINKDFQTKFTFIKEDNDNGQN